MYIYINTAEKNRLLVALKEKNKTIVNISKQITYSQSELLLSLLNQLFKKAKMKLSDISGIAVVNGPGSFTAVRIGVVVANTLSWSLKIPVVSFKTGERVDYVKLEKQKDLKLVDVYYENPPNITKSKKRW